MLHVNIPALAEAVGGVTTSTEGAGGGPGGGGGLWAIAGLANTFISVSAVSAKRYLDM
jgi:hypothetical protein